MARAARKKAPPPSPQLGLHIGASLPARAPAAAPPTPATRAVASAAPTASTTEKIRISDVFGAGPAPSAPPAPVARPQTLADMEPRYAPQRPSFGSWLLQQKERSGFVGALAKAAIADRGFPKTGDPEAVLARLETVGADSDMFEALEDAERAWRAA